MRLKQLNGHRFNSGSDLGFFSFCKFDGKYFLTKYDNGYSEPDDADSKYLTSFYLEIS
jgi:hypothetical protein